MVTGLTVRKTGFSSWRSSASRFRAIRKERARTAALIRLLEKETIQSEDQARLEALLENKAKGELEDDVVEQIASSLLENKIEEGIPFLGEIAGVLLDNAFIDRIEEAARCTFQERWLRDQGKVGVIAPAEGHQRAGTSLGAGLTQAVYSTSYAVSFGVVFPAALVAQAGTAVLPSAAVDGLKAGAESAARDAKRLLAGPAQQGNPVPDALPDTLARKDLTN